MTLFLASVRNEAEALTALAAGADIVDLKDPARGALGAVEARTLAASVEAIAGRAGISATTGDLPLDAPSLPEAVRATASAGVDYVKLGLFPAAQVERFAPHERHRSTLPACCSMPLTDRLILLRSRAAPARLVLVLFADAPLPPDAIEVAVGIDAHGVMLDTMGKGSGSLLDHLDLAALARFVETAKGEGLMVGLAGSLGAHHVPDLLRLEPDLLGFRGALCHAGARNAAIEPASCARIRALIPRASGALSDTDLPQLAAEALC